MKIVYALRMIVVKECYSEAKGRRISRECEVRVSGINPEILRFAQDDKEGNEIDDNDDDDNNNDKI